MTIKSFMVGLALTGLLIPSCKPQRPDTAGQIDSLRTQVEALVKAQTLMSYKNSAFGEESNQDSLYKANASLFTLDNIKLVTEAESQEPDSLQKRRLWYLRRFLTSEFISKQTASLTDRRSNIEATATVSVDGKNIPYRQIAGMIANEQIQAQRSKLYEATAPVLDSLNGVLRQTEEINQRVAKELGYASYNAMAEELKQFSLNDFKGVAEHVLAETDSEYTILLKEVLSKTLKLRLKDFHRYDVGPLFRRVQFDRYFPEATMMDQLKQTYGGMGIDINAQTNLRIDTEKRENKDPRAACYPIDVPNDVRLSIKPIGGFDDYSSLFHEMGHGLHYSSTTQNAMEFKYLGERTVTETYAFLSEYLLANQAWLRMHGNMAPPILKDLIRTLTFERLFLIRRYCAKFLYELELHSGVANPEKLYANLVNKAIGCQQNPSDEKRYLTDLDELYYSASYLRAWFLEAQLNAKLTSEFGVNWFENKQAGTFLVSLWSHGDRLNGDELVRQLGYDSISPDKLLKEIHMMIILSTKPGA